MKKLRNRPLGFNVFIKRGCLDGLWWICHARSGQNAFYPEFNGYKDKQLAIDYAVWRGCQVVKERGIS